MGSQTTTRLTPADSAGAYLPPGWLLFVRNGTLVAQGFDASRGELRGEPLTVAETVGINANVRRRSILDIGNWCGDLPVGRGSVPRPS